MILLRPAAGRPGSAFAAGYAKDGPPPNRVKCAARVCWGYVTWPLACRSDGADLSLIEQAEMTEDEPTAKSDAFTKRFDPSIYPPLKRAKNAWLTLWSDLCVRWLTR